MLVDVMSVLLPSLSLTVFFPSLFQELEHGLNEQRDLTKAIAVQCSRARTQIQSTDEYTGYLNTHTVLICTNICLHFVTIWRSLIVCRPSAAKENEDKRQEVELAVHRKWTHLCIGLTKTAETEQDRDKDQDHSEVWTVLTLL